MAVCQKRSFGTAYGSGSSVESWASYSLCQKRWRRVWHGPLHTLQFNSHQGVHCVALASTSLVNAGITGIRMCRNAAGLTSRCSMAAWAAIRMDAGLQR